MMDPNKTLHDARQAQEEIDRLSENLDAASAARLAAIADHLDIISHSFKVLDEWLSSGGFLPEAWKR